MQDGYKFGSLDQLFFFSNFRINWIMPLSANRVDALYRIYQEWVCSNFHIPAALMTDSFWPFPGLFPCSWPCPGFTHLLWSLRLLKTTRLNILEIFNPNIFSRSTQIEEKRKVKLISKIIHLCGPMFLVSFDHLKF